MDAALAVVRFVLCIYILFMTPSVPSGQKFSLGHVYFFAYFNEPTNAAYQEILFIFQSPLCEARVYSGRVH